MLLLHNVTAWGCRTSATVFEPCTKIRRAWTRSLPTVCLSSPSIFPARSTYKMERIMADMLAPGAMVAHYRVTSPLGQGGMGAVYLADDTRLGRRVALKVLPPEFAADPDRMHRFVQEARLASALTHPNVATIFEIGQQGELWFLAMEYVVGRPLAQ